ncbi:CorA family divalent cation transporter [Rhodococcus sp. APC 3903]|uniref:CorA family divalent cation transporter n=1 Tax=Rhodococcus sp. APC 3903 TaxID=3035193 RepID=UPI0025B311FE|nr:CorA family divalent cation transporter [Rhodococcus sp. APC 3903]MDN3459883.1 CorA family divalent cation transporter [Rhodococcus sp. APC 3903]
MAPLHEESAEDIDEPFYEGEIDETIFDQTWRIMSQWLAMDKNASDEVLAMGRESERLQRLTDTATESLEHQLSEQWSQSNPGKIPESALGEVRRRGSRFVWLGLFAPTFEQMTAITQTYGLHELVAEDSVHAHQRPKLEQYDKVTVLVMRTAHYLSPISIRTAGDIVETGEILAAVGSVFIVTVRHGAHTALAGVRAELEGSREHLQMGPWAVLHAVIDRIVDGYLGVVGSVDVDIDTLEVELLGPDPLHPHRADLSRQARGARIAALGQPARGGAIHPHHDNRPAGPDSQGGTQAAARRRRTPRRGGRTNRRIRRCHQLTRRTDPRPGQSRTEQRPSKPKFPKLFRRGGRPAR